MVRLTGRALDLAPKAKIDLPLAVYLGPKQREVLQGNLAAGTDTPEHRNQTDHALYQYSKLLQFNTCFLYRPCYIEDIAFLILRGLDFLKRTIAFGNYGVAIMILVIVVRAILHPLTRTSQISMAKMSKQMRDVAPKLEAMKKKYPDNKRKQNEEMMRIYRENNINPAGGIMGCIPMLIQMPIWVALYAGLRADIDLRHMPFIPGWINDLASPDAVWPHAAQLLGHPLFSIPLLGEIYGLNLLPILLIGVFYFQMKVSTASQPKPADDQQAQMQKMSQYMIFIFPLFLYNAPSGLNLYIFASTMGGLLDTYIVRKSLKKQGLLAPTAPLLPTHEGDDKKS
jgi:YidC/Oxa1 family membrane protein insertase